MGVAARSALAERGLVEPPAPGAPASSPGATPGVIAEALESAGFTEHRVEPLDFAIEYPCDFERLVDDAAASLLALTLGRRWSATAPRSVAAQPVAEGAERATRQLAARTATLAVAGATRGVAGSPSA